MFHKKAPFEGKYRHRLSDVGIFVNGILIPEETKEEKKARKQKEKEEKVSVYMPLVDFYKEYVKKESVNVLTEEQINARWDIVNNMEFCTERDDMTYDTFAAMHVKEAEVPDELIVSASRNADTAVITLSRFSAEGVDRRPQGGDYYLSDLEKDLIDKATALFGKVVIIINSGATMDCEYFAENDKVQAVFGSEDNYEGFNHLNHLFLCNKDIDKYLVLI